jgi:riboflavin synthase
LLERSTDGNSDKLTWSIPEGFERYLASKGSASISGVSLTVCEVTPETFSVYIVPHTSEATTLSLKKVGDIANFEVDMLARYVVNALDKAEAHGALKPPSRLDHEFLVKHGFAEAE